MTDTTPTPPPESSGGASLRRTIHRGCAPMPLMRAEEARQFERSARHLEERRAQRANETDDDSSVDWRIAVLIVVATALLSLVQHCGARRSAPETSVHADAADAALVSATPAS